jgi:ATP-dependent Lhr-like helicase
MAPETKPTLAIPEIADRFRNFQPPRLRYHPRMATRPAPCDAAALDRFSPAVRNWFANTFAAPTPVQAAAWPVIANGAHVLVTAPTGSGKTLTAFLWALDQFAAGRATPGRTRVLYVSPLKALNNDIRRNLLDPLGALAATGAVPPLRAETRSGDTAQADRQRLLRHPPEILITTPESLLLMLSTVRGRHALADVATVIVDEVHALVDNRRGTLLFTALERLAQLAGEFQRIVLSATVRPLDAVAAFAAGTGPDGRPRRMAIVDAAAVKAIELDVRFPADAVGIAEQGVKLWVPLAAAFRTHIAANRATLFFVNSRRLAEKLTFQINDGEPAPLAWAHHGSMARELRLAVEQRLKAGTLKGIVATSSLELGIDIGNLDEVVLIQAPPDVASTLQRIGRAGHSVGAVSRATLYPTHPEDFIEAAALARAVAARDIEPIHLLANPLDVLAQLLVAFTASEPWQLDDLYALLCRSGPYRTLSREHFDLVVEMQGGRYADNRVRELKPRLRIDRIRHRVEAERSAVMAFHSSGGVIPDRGYFQLRHADTGAAIGELDEEYVWEATTGQVFTFGTQNWQIRRITHNDVLAHPTDRPANAPPFWRSETRSRSFHFSARIGAFLEEADDALARRDRAGLMANLVEERRFEPTAAESLVLHLERQREATAMPLPHTHHVLAETVATGPGGYRTPGEMRQLVLHTFWGLRVNQPLALAMRAALRAAGQSTAEGDIEFAASDNAIILLSREALDASYVLGLVNPENLLPLLRASLESSGFFGARFREAAGRALLLTRQRFNARLPLWVSRLQAKKLMSSVHDFADFPLLLECWRACLDDEFDLPALIGCLRGLDEGTIRLGIAHTRAPSPFAAGLAWNQINRYMYADDQPELGTPTALSDDLIEAAVGNAALRPKLKAETIAAFLERRQRTAPGYAPETGEEWADWIRERVLLTEAELAVPLEHPDVTRLCTGDRCWWVHRELLQGLVGSGLCAGATFDGPAPPVADRRSAEDFALETLSFHGPLNADEIARLLPAVPADMLEESDELVRGTLLAADPEGTYYCDRQNYESMLRLQRARARPVIEPRPATALPAFLASWQGLGAPGPDDLTDRLTLLSGYRAPVSAWLGELPAARSTTTEPSGPVPADVDRALEDAGFAWQGAGSGQIRAGDPEDLALLDAPRSEPPFAVLFADPDAGYGFNSLADRQSESLEQFNDVWWEAVWGGGLTADSLQPLREGIARDFRLTTAAAAVRRAARRPAARARAPRYRDARGIGWSGYWRLLPPPEPPEDPLAELDDARERARLLLDRYGVVCREIANREGERLRWAALFRALRLMELAGEVTAGYFFTGLSGPQFATPAAVQRLEANAPGGPTFWVSALDPVAPCGLGLDWAALPPRRAQNHLSFLDGQLALVLENQGRRLTFTAPVPEEALTAVLAPLAWLLAREHRLAVETIDGAPATGSGRLEALAAIGRVVRDHRGVWLEEL